MTPKSSADAQAGPAVATRRAPTAATAERGLNLAVGLLFCLSGVPALIDQVVWQRILALHSGVGAFSVAVIVAAYMAGLGLGSLSGGVLSRRLGRVGSLRAFAVAELAIGCFAAFSPRLYYEMPLVPAEWFRGTTWRVGLVHFVALLPPTTLMGMTLPLLVRAVVRDVPHAAQVIGRLYGLNILGAAAGALVTPWLLVPRLGLSGAVLVGVGCNAVVGTGALLTGLAVGRPSAPPRPADEPAGDAVGPRRRPFGLWVVLYAFSGFVAVALEVVWFRLIDVGVKATAYTFGTVLAVYLTGLAAGTLLGARLSRRWPDPLGAFLTCQCGILISTGLSVLLMCRLPPESWPIAGWFQYWAGYEPLSPRGGGIPATFGLYGVFPAALYGIPTVLMGLSFAALQKGVQDDAATSGYKVGLLQAANIAGCVLGSVSVGLWWFASPGTAATLRLLVASGLSLAGLGLAATSTRPRFAGLAAALGLLALLMPDQDTLWRRLHGDRGGAALIAEDTAGVAALQPEGGRWRMSTNGKGQSHLPFGGVHSKLGAMPATLHPAPRSVAIIGLGSGDTAWAAACREETESVTVFETCPGQRGLLERLARREDLEGLRPFLADPRVKVVEADGRHALATGGARYDLIEADAIRPNGAYSGNLYSAEFFELCRERLKPGGLMCTWAPTPRTTTTFRQAFPHVVELDNGVILIGSNEPIELDPESWRERVLKPEVAAYLGPEAHGECVRCLPTAKALPPPAAPDPDRVNTDLFPRDEYERPLGAP